MSQRLMSAPPYARKNAIYDDSVAEPQNQIEHGCKCFVGHEMRFEAQIEQAGVRRIIVKLLHLLSRVIDVLDSHGQANALASALHAFGKIVDRERFSELIEDPKLAPTRRIGCCERDALQRIANIKIAASLPPFAINRQR